ncbi:MAG: nuclear transport factor 2 family protein [Rhodospirillaceae bacterium]
MKAMRRTVFSLCLAMAGAAPAAEPADVVSAERAFAADAQARGLVLAFKRAAAPDAIVFQPDVVNAQESLARQPEDPPNRSLNWWPVWAGMARSGDLGFTTGPFTVGGDKAFGHYFTVWERQPDGAWRWIFDGGASNAAKSPLGPDTQPAFLPAATAVAVSAAPAWAEVRTLEAELAVAAAVDAKTAYLKYLTPDARVMGSREQPSVGPEAIAAELSRRPAAMDFKPLGGKASRAGDLVFTYGEAHWLSGNTANGQAGVGHYVRIWQNRRAGWRLVFDEVLAVPPKKPS